MRLPAVAVVVVVAGSVPAFADPDDTTDPGPVQAELDCGIAGRALSPLDKNVIAGHVACSVVLDGFSADGLSANAWVVQGGVEGTHHTGTAVVGKSDEDADRFSFDPFTRGTELKPCSDFTVHAELILQGEIAWSTDLPVATKCKKPKSISAKLSCTAIGSDGTVFAYPGSGAKQKPRLDDTLACWIVGPKSGGDSLTATINGHSEALWQDDDSHAWSSAEMLEADDDFTACQSFRVDASVANGDGQVVWSGKLAIAQHCDD